MPNSAMPEPGRMRATVTVAGAAPKVSVQRAVRRTLSRRLHTHTVPGACTLMSRPAFVSKTRWRFCSLVVVVKAVAPLI